MIPLSWYRGKALYVDGRSPTGEVNDKAGDMIYSETMREPGDFILKIWIAL
jgi:hypothetical protein